MRKKNNDQAFLNLVNEFKKQPDFFQFQRALTFIYCIAQELKNKILAHAYHVVLLSSIYQLPLSVFQMDGDQHILKADSNFLDRIHPFITHNEIDIAADMMVKSISSFIYQPLPEDANKILYLHLLLSTVTSSADLFSLNPNACDLIKPYNMLLQNMISPPVDRRSLGLFIGGCVLAVISIAVMGLSFKFIGGALLLTGLLLLAVSWIVAASGALHQTPKFSDRRNIRGRTYYSVKTYGDKLTTEESKEPVEESKESISACSDILFFNNRDLMANEMIIDSIADYKSLLLPHYQQITILKINADFSADNKSWKDLCELMSDKPDLVTIDLIGCTLTKQQEEQLTQILKCNHKEFVRVVPPTNGFQIQIS